MGAWGNGPLDNDSALDAIFEHENNLPRGLRKLLKRKNDEDYQQQEVLGVAAQILKIGFDIPSDCRQGVLNVLYNQMGREALASWNEPRKRLMCLRTLERRISP